MTHAHDGWELVLYWYLRLDELLRSAMQSIGNVSLSLAFSHSGDLFQRPEQLSERDSSGQVLVGNPIPNTTHAFSTDLMLLGTPR